jgi:hypothetical protein
MRIPYQIFGTKAGRLDHCLYAYFEKMAGTRSRRHPRVGAGIKKIRLARPDANWEGFDYTQSLIRKRLRVMYAVENGQTTREVGAIFQVSPGFISNVHQRWLPNGHAHPKAIGDYRRALPEPYEGMQKEQLSSNPSMTLKEVQTWPVKRTRFDRFDFRH